MLRKRPSAFHLVILLGTVVPLVLAGCSPAEAPLSPVPTQSPLTDEARVLETVDVEKVVEVEAREVLMLQGTLGREAPAWLEPPNDAAYPDTYFEEYGVNPFIDTEDDNLSTFAIDVDTGSYTIMRSYINRGDLPPDESVRVEEYINYFEQDYELPAEKAFAIHLEGAPAPYGESERYHLVRVGIQGYDVAPEERPDATLIFVIDVSGSMDIENRLGLVKQSLRLLVESLRPTDRIGIVVYGSSARTVLEPTYVGARAMILDAIDQVQPGGSTNAEHGIMLAYQWADQYHDKERINRLILCSDGVANVGNTAAESILQHAAERISLSTFGFGMGNYNDVLMEQLADQGDGSYAYIDTLDEAERVFIHDLTSTLLVIAKDAKIQVAFNPAVVERYRLLGYENRDVADEDFRNDDVDAGEIGAGHSVTALYEVKLAPEADAAAEALTVYVRYADPETGAVTEIERAVTPAAFAEGFEAASPRFQLAAVVAEYAEILRDSYWARGHSLEALVVPARRIAEYLSQDSDVQEFAQLVAAAARLAGGD